MNTERPVLSAEEIERFRQYLYDRLPAADSEKVRVLCDMAVATASRPAGADPYLLLVDDQTAVKVGGSRFDGWLFRKHSDGPWVSVRKLEREDLE